MGNRKTLSAVASLLSMILVSFAGVSGVEKAKPAPRPQLPDPDAKPAAMDKPVKVFIMLGQSNMLGFGRLGPENKQGTLEHLTRKLRQRKKP